MECKFDTFYMQSINCYILELSQCIKACIIYKLLLLYYYTPSPHPCPTIHSRFSTTHSSTPRNLQHLPSLNRDYYHPLTLSFSPIYPILPKKAAFRQPPIVHLKPQLRSTLRSLSNFLCSRSVLHD